MSDAAVEFVDANHEEPCEEGREVAFSFQCPRYNRRCGDLIIAGRTELRRDGQNRNGGVAQWDWDGNRDRPTFSPSINCGGCWHGYIVKGRCVGTDRRTDEPEPPKRGS